MAPKEHVGHGGVDLAGGGLAGPHQAQDLPAAGRGDGGEDGAVEHHGTEFRLN
jgi:hypothetical protein